MTSDKIYLAKSGIPGGGRGVYAKRDIKKGEIVETCPFIAIPAHEVASLSESILITYFFYFGRNKASVALALGFGSLYNHSYSPNIEFKIRPKETTINFVALNAVTKGTELTFNYFGSGKSKGKKKPLWFEV